MNITSGVEKKALSVLIYGREGIGKSTFAAGAKEPIFLKLEDRLSHIPSDKTDLISNLTQLDQALVYLKTQDHKYKTVVIDSVDWLEALVQAEVAKANKVKTIADIGYGKGFVEVAVTIREIINSLSELRNNRKMNLIFIAHAKIKKFDDPAREAYDRYQLDLHERTASILTQYVDNILFADFDIYLEDGKAKATKRVLFTEPSPSYVAKNSFNLPRKIELSWSAFVLEVNKFYLPKEVADGK